MYGMQVYDWKKIGLRVGLELHQQLDTKHKLFCNCSTVLVNEPESRVLIRRLRPTLSELGEVDVAALFEWKRGRYYVYEAVEQACCLVEADEEPPHMLNMEALLTAIIISLMLNARVVDEVHVMRKIVIDGSNTTGFQRTAIVAMGGWIEDEEGRVGIQTICLEEDAARKIEERGKAVVYRLDRLGIPLIEIATTPDIHTPEQAERVAYKIGQYLRMTGRVKRGLGTIRQDLNVSIKGGEKVEIKGVQKLELISKVVEYEALRQLRLLEIREELKKRGLSKDMINYDIIDVSEIFANTKCKVIRKVLKKGGKVMALKLPGFKGIVGKELQPGRRFGTELADYARFWADVKGLFHTDELPAYGISEAEVNRLYEKMGADPSRDAIVLIADEEYKAIEGLKSVADRAREAFDGIPKETRGANPDGTTRYLRPQPGAARMYPETDIPLIEITPELIEKAYKMVPEKPEEKYERFVREYGLSDDLARQVLSSYRLDLFEYLAEKYRSVPPTLIASTIVSLLKALRKDGVPVGNIEDSHIDQLFNCYVNGMLPKESFEDVLSWIAENPECSIEDAIKSLGIRPVSMEVVERRVEEVIQAHREEVKALGHKAFKRIMGIVMKEFRGKVDGRIVAEIVRNKIKELLNQE